TVNSKSQPFKNGSVPFTITFGQVIVHGYNVYAFASQCVQVSRQCRYQGFTFTGSHFRNFTLMQHGTANELYIVMHHVPGNKAAAGSPAVFENRLVALYSDIIFFNAELAIEIGCRGYYFSIFLKTAGCFFYYGKCFGLNFFQHFFNLLVAIFYKGIYLLVNGVFTYDIAKRQFFCLFIQSGNFVVYLLQMRFYTLFEFLGFIAQLVV